MVAMIGFGELITDSKIFYQASINFLEFALEVFFSLLLQNGKNMKNKHASRMTKFTPGKALIRPNWRSHRHGTSPRNISLLDKLRY